MIILNGYDLTPILNGAPRINDQLSAVCRTLEFSVQNTENLDNYLGQSVELWYGGIRWFKGDLRRRGFTSGRAVNYLVYDPLFYTGKNPDDYYFENSTATQDFREMARKIGIKVANLEDTGAVLAAAYYENADADKVMIDRLARTKEVSGRNFWYRYDPEADGLILFEKKIPSNVWAFMTGENGTLVSAEMEESVEDTIAVVQLINRNTGKTVTKVNEAILQAYGHTVHREEVDKDETTIMEELANRRLETLSKVNVTMKAEGINPNNLLPQFFSGDVIYVQEKYSRLMGGYYIRNVTHTFESKALVTLSFDLTAAPDVPTVQFDDANIDAAKKNKSTDEKGVGVQQEYNTEVKEVMKQYGLGG